MKLKIALVLFMFLEPFAWAEPQVGALPQVKVFRSLTRAQREGELKNSPFFELTVQEMVQEKGQSTLPGMEWESLAIDERDKVADRIYERERKQAELEKQFQVIEAVSQRTLFLDPNQSENWSHQQVVEAVATYQKPGTAAPFYPLVDVRNRGYFPVDPDPYWDLLTATFARVTYRVYASKSGKAPLEQEEQKQLSALGVRLLAEVYAVAALAHSEKTLAHEAALFNLAGFVANLAVSIGVSPFSPVASLVVGGLAVIQASMMCRNTWVRDFETGRALLPTRSVKARAARKTFGSFIRRFWFHFRFEMDQLGIENGEYRSEWSADLPRRGMWDDNWEGRDEVPALLKLFEAGKDIQPDSKVCISLLNSPFLKSDPKPSPAKD